MTMPSVSTGAGVSPEQEKTQIYIAGQWKLMAYRFRKHRLAVLSSIFIVGLYLLALFAGFIAPYSLDHRDQDEVYVNPQKIHFIGEDGFHLRPFVYALQGYRHPLTLRKLYREDTSTQYPLKLFAHGDEYRLLGLFKTDMHLFGVDSPATIHLLGTDSLGRDLFSRIVHGARISLTVGLFGVFISFCLGLIIGAVSGFYGGMIDNLIQRIIEIIKSFPTIPLWMALGAALPQTWTPLQIYFGITVVLSLVGWTELARVVRGRILTLREEDFATAAILAGATRWRLMWRHLLPSTASHVIVSLTLAVPTMILGETALSFLGLGLRPPVTSWGVLLKESMNVQAVAQQPWLLSPALFVILAVLAFNFIGDGLRDAADPYER